MTSRQRTGLMLFILACFVLFSGKFEPLWLAAAVGGPLAGVSSWMWIWD